MPETHEPTHLLPLAERLAAGKAHRQQTPRSSHAQWEANETRPDPIDMLERSSAERLTDLVPVRYGRMMRSPFTFLRGSAQAMACDLATTPTTGIRTQVADPFDIIGGHPGR